MVKRSEIDKPFNTQLYGMRVMPYEGIYLGFITAYHGETIKPIPTDKLWMDRKNVQLAFSRNGITWMRVGPNGAIRPDAQHSEAEWKRIASQAAFLPYGRLGRDWDAGVIHAHQAPLLIGDKIRIYYQAQNGRNWWNFHGDKNRDGVGLATLRLDGFVSVDAASEGTLTTKPLLFIGDTLIVNADAAGGSISVEALDVDGKPIAGFTRKDAAPLTTNAVRHVVRWRKSDNCHLLQGRPVKLRFHLKSAKLYSFEFKIRRNNYVPSYD